MTRKAQILEIVESGPITSPELADLLGISTHLASAHLRYLWRDGALRRRPFVFSGRQRRDGFIYSTAEI